MRNYLDRFGIITVSLLVIVGIFVLSGCSDKTEKPREVTIGDCFMTNDGYTFNILSKTEDKDGVIYNTLEADGTEVPFSQWKFNLYEAKPISCEIYKERKQGHILERVRNLEYKLDRHLERIKELESKNNATKR